MSDQITYRGMEYDPQKDYLGPENSSISKFIPKNPPGLEFLHVAWNKAAFFHDGDYKGKKETGFFGIIKNYFTRSRADGNFFNRLANSLDRSLDEGIIAIEEYNYGMAYSRLCHKAVRAGGWKFYRID